MKDSDISDINIQMHGTKRTRHEHSRRNHYNLPAIICQREAIKNGGI